MKRRVINPWKWQDNLGFVQGNEVNGATRTLYCAGQVSVDGDGNLLHPGDMGKQITQILNNLEEVLKESDMRLSDVVKMTYFTTDMQTFFQGAQVLNERLQAGNCRPATSLIGVASLFHPDCIVEIEATATV